MHHRGPTRTARKVARTVAYVGQDPQTAALLPEGAAEATTRLLRASRLLKPAQLEQMRKPWVRRSVAWLERHVLPGQSLYLGLRKRFFDDEVREALANGATQVLVLGAGLDTLALRLSEAFPDVRFVELDHPGPTSAKLAALREMQVKRENLRMIGADLGAIPVTEALREAPGWSRLAPSVIVAEGVLMYLSGPEVESLFHDLARATGRETRFLFSFVVPDASGRPSVGRLDRTLRGSFRLIGEPLRWAIAESDLSGLLERHDWRATKEASRLDLRRRFLEPVGLGEAPMLQLERFAVAERA